VQPAAKLDGALNTQFKNNQNLEEITKACEQILPDIFKELREELK
jgi:hypothetical protein